ncbi:MAG TPA: hypothetical protein VNT79_13295 [Phycisphaerae bacterium]|nr:hypothetical protein [Phycisphaerae bacterium]
MLRKLFTTAFALAFVSASAVTTGCKEDEHKVTEKKETTYESEPTDTDQGEMVVE